MGKTATSAERFKAWRWTVTHWAGLYRVRHGLFHVKSTRSAYVSAIVLLRINYKLICFTIHLVFCKWKPFWTRKTWNALLKRNYVISISRAQIWNPNDNLDHKMATVRSIIYFLSTLSKFHVAMSLKFNLQIQCVKQLSVQRFFRHISVLFKCLQLCNMWNPHCGYNPLKFYRKLPIYWRWFSEMLSKIE